MRVRVEEQAAPEGLLLVFSTVYILIGLCLSHKRFDMAPRRFSHHCLSNLQFPVLEQVTKISEIREWGTRIISLTSDNSS